MARRSLFQEQYDTDIIINYSCVEKDRKQYQSETTWGLEVVYHQHLRIYEFV